MIHSSDVVKPIVSIFANSVIEAIQTKGTIMYHIILTFRNFALYPQRVYMGSI
jgi:hypothetical protein